MTVVGARRTKTRPAAWLERRSSGRDGDPACHEDRRPHARSAPVPHPARERGRRRAGSGSKRTDESGSLAVGRRRRSGPLRHRVATLAQPGKVRLEPDHDRHAHMFVAMGLRLVSAAVAPNSHFHLVSIAEVAPPQLRWGQPTLTITRSPSWWQPTGNVSRRPLRQPVTVITARLRLNNGCRGELSIVLTTGLAVRLSTANSA